MKTMWSGGSIENPTWPGGFPKRNADHATLQLDCSELLSGWPDHDLIDVHRDRLLDCVRDGLRDRFEGNAIP
jgi:hypothetical protein